MAPVPTARRVCEVRETGLIQRIIDVHSIAKPGIEWAGRIGRSRKHTAYEQAQGDVCDIIEQAAAIWKSRRITSQ